MQISARKAEVLVPRTKVWWTFLALTSDDRKFEELSFVSELTPGPGTAIVDAEFLRKAIPLLKNKRALVLLWDGYRTYLEQKTLIDLASREAAQVELCIVGDILNFRSVHPPRCSPLFSQQIEYYSRPLVSKKMSRAIFSGQLESFAFRHRSSLISGKVLLQLIARRRLFEYRKTKFVYCGSNGLSLLKTYSAEYQNAPTQFNEGCSQIDFVSRWISAIHEKKGSWINQIIVRSLLRFIALETLNSQTKHAIFLNIYPQPNINVYQAGLLFEHHVFLEFGGSVGDETIYPRFADMVFLNRKVLHFDMKTAAEELIALNPQDYTAISEFLTRYKEFVISQLDECSKINSCTRKVGQGLRISG